MRVTDQIVLGISGLLGGMTYPSACCPVCCDSSRLTSVTCSLEGMRAAGWCRMRELWPSIAVLLLFAAILIPLSFLVFGWAPRGTRVTGTLTHI